MKKLAQVAVMAVGAAVGGWAITGFEPPIASKRDRIEAILLEPPIGDVYRAIQQYYPADAEEWLTQIEILMSDQARLKSNPNAGFDIGAQLRQRRAPALAHASDESLRAVIDQNIAMYAWSRSDPALCAQLLVEGPMVLSADERIAFLERVDAALLWQVIHEGDTQPVQRGPATDADWEAFVEAYLASGETREDLAVVLSGDATNPGLCNAMLDYLEVIRDADFPGADRVRAEVAVAIAQT